MKTLSINGKERKDLDISTVEQLIALLELPASAILVEHNGMVLHRTEWSTTLLQSGDRIELLRITAGG